MREAVFIKKILQKAQRLFNKTGKAQKRQKYSWGKGALSTWRLGIGLMGDRSGGSQGLVMAKLFDAQLKEAAFAPG